MTAAQKQIAVIDEVPSKETALEVYTGTMGLDPWIEKIRTEALSLVPDTSTKKGRDAIASMAYKVRQAKSALDKVGKELVDRLKEQPKLVDAERKRMRETLDALAEQVRKPLDEFEAKETARIDALKARLDAIDEYKIAGSGSDSLVYVGYLKSVKAIQIDDSWQEFEAEAARRKDAAIQYLDDYIAERQKHEAEQAELARLRAEAEERAKKDREEQIAREAAEKAKREVEEAAAREKSEAEAKAKAEREAAERRELELKLAAEKAEKDRLAAEQATRDAEERAAKAAAETEARLKREAEEKAEAERREVARREADKKHRAKINNDAAFAFVVAGFNEKDARQIVTMIAQGNVPNVKISY